MAGLFRRSRRNIINEGVDLSVAVQFNAPAVIDIIKTLFYQRVETGNSNFSLSLFEKLQASPNNLTCVLEPAVPNTSVDEVGLALGEVHVLGRHTDSLVGTSLACE